jgi:hypothetical protein
MGRVSFLSALGVATMHRDEGHAGSLDGVFGEEAVRLAKVDDEALDESHVLGLHLVLGTVGGESGPSSAGRTTATRCRRHAGGSPSIRAADRSARLLDGPAGSSDE